MIKKVLDKIPSIRNILLCVYDLGQVDSFELFNSDILSETAIGSFTRATNSKTPFDG